jgi:hypothetical protein
MPNPLLVLFPSLMGLYFRVELVSKLGVEEEGAKEGYVMRSVRRNQSRL